MGESECWRERVSVGERVNVGGRVWEKSECGRE